MSTLPDPFDGDGTNFVEKRFLDVADMHHQFDKVTAPRAVHDYRVVHFVGEDNTFNVCNLVHTMYRVVFSNSVDREEMTRAFSIGETIAVLNEERTEAISGITFVARPKSVVVLFVATAIGHQQTGMATFLFSLLFHHLCRRHGCKTILINLKANPDANNVAYGYYTNRKFKLMKDSANPDFPADIMRCFESEATASPLRNYLERTNDLVWLSKTFFVRDFQHPKLEVNHQFYNNASGKAGNNVYACLPGTLSLEQLDNCHPNRDTQAGSLLCEKIFCAEGDAEDDVDPILGSRKVSVSWCVRCLTQRHEGLSGDIYDLVLAWLQRHGNARIWREVVTIVPAVIMTGVSVMLDLYECYKERTILSEGIEKLAAFNDELDVPRFFKASAPVMEYILENKHMFIKRHIALVTYDEYDAMSWNATITVNAGMIESSGSDDGAQPCGYVHFSPTADNCNAPNSVLFFLKLAFFVCNPSTTVPTHANAKRKGRRAGQFQVPDVLTPWFETMDEFVTFMESAQFFQEDSFVRVDVSPTSVLSTPSFPELNGMKALSFVLDFLVSLETLKIDNVDGKWAVSGIGESLPLTSSQVTLFCEQMRLSMLQIIDRVASTQMGPRREKESVYGKYMVPLDDNKLLMPKWEDSTFCDFALIGSWKRVTHNVQNAAIGPESLLNPDGIAAIVPDSPLKKGRKPRMGKGKGKHG